MSCFTNQKPFQVDAQQAKNFRAGKRRFGCALCEKEFQAGDTVRWVYANGSNGLNTGNFFVCPEHDTPDVLDKAKESFETARKLAKQWGIYGPDWV